MKYIYLALIAWKLFYSISCSIFSFLFSELCYIFYILDFMFIFHVPWSTFYVLFSACHKYMFHILHMHAHYAFYVLWYSFHVLCYVFYVKCSICYVLCYMIRILHFFLCYVFYVLCSAFYVQRFILYVPCATVFCFLYTLFVCHFVVYSQHLIFYVSIACIL